MRRLHSYLYLILGALVMVATCKKSKAVVLKDVIWYPVDEEEGVFISIYGEKYTSKWPYQHSRGIRSTQPLVDDDYQRNFLYYPGSYLNLIPIIDSFGRRSKRQNFGQPGSWNFRLLANPFLDSQFNYPSFETFQDISDLQNIHRLNNNDINQNGQEWMQEPGQIFNRPATSLIETEPKMSFWIGNPSHGPNGQFNSEMFHFQRPFFHNENTLKAPWNLFTPQIPNRPQFQNSYGEETWSKPFTGQTENPKNTGPKGFRPSTEEPIVFPEENPPATKPSTSEGQATEPTTMSPCERRCPVTPEFNPICGSDSVTYNNIGRLKCAQNCGKVVSLVHYGTCRNSRLAMPPRWNRS